MGYYTSYNLDVNNVKSRAEHEKLHDALNKMGIIGYALDGSDWSDSFKVSTFWSCDCVKWYDHDEDMVEISKKFPEMTFKLIGNGESDDDRWYTLYRNGELETVEAMLIWPEPKKIEWKE